MNSGIRLPVTFPLRFHKDFQRISMGRLPLGDVGCSTHSARMGLWRRKTNATHLGLLVAPTRRKKFGLYSVLEVEPDAKPEEIKREYRKLALKYHPDKCAGATSQARSIQTKRFQLVNAAYEVLSDPVLRADYDRQHFSVETNESTIRVKVHRHRQSKTERAIAESLQTARTRIKKGTKKEAPRSAKRKVAMREVSAKNRTLKHGDTWTILKRTKRERKKDRRLGRFVAFPTSSLVD